MKRSESGRLTPRKEQVLAAIIETYVSQGEPVGSKVLSDELNVSSATIRNDMASLSELGYIEQTHTSSGRVPSQNGYRKYVDSIMKKNEVTPERQMELDKMLLLDVYDSADLLRNASLLLAGLSGSAAFSTTPSSSDAVVRGVQFVQLGRRTAMAILLASSGAMKNKLFRCDFDLTAEMTRIFFRVMNERLAGKYLKDITPAFVQSMAASMGSELSALLLQPIMAVVQMANEALDTEIILGGQMNLLFCKDYTSSDVKSIIGFLESKDLARLIAGKHRKDKSSVEILIGRESNQPELCESSVLMSHYNVAGEPAGVIGIVGSTRVDYQNMIPNLSYIASSVGRTLTDMMQEA